MFAQQHPYSTPNQHTTMPSTTRTEQQHHNIVCYTRSNALHAILYATATSPDPPLAATSLPSPPFDHGITPKNRKAALHINRTTDLHHVMQH